MKRDLGSYRKTYDKYLLDFDNVPENPFTLFNDWFEYVDTNFKTTEANAMTVTTIGKDGYPKGRVLLLKSYSEEGFIFYTNYESEKGQDIAKNKNVCLSFFWAEAQRQVIIKGSAEKTSNAVSDDYFNSRPRGSQLGALVSNQSTEIASKEVLEKKLIELSKQYEGKVIPRPSHWGGYIVKPVSIEFWQGRPNRLHDRMCYTFNAKKAWDKAILAP